MKISDELYSEIRNSTCGSCKFYEQKEMYSCCSHENATSEEKSYRYYNFHCDTQYKYEKGVHESKSSSIEREKLRNERLNNNK